MISSVIYFILAAFGLGLIVFIHEFGHYWMARKEGMKVEVFSIGFGSPICDWQYQGVKWQLCWLPFGGYVRIAGMEKEGPLEPYQIPNGFYAKKPWARIKVAFMGPLINAVFALFIFCVLWLSGGRQDSFSDHTQIVGWVDSDLEACFSEIYPGDRITQINNKPLSQFRQLYAYVALEEQAPKIQGTQINYLDQKQYPFTLICNDANQLKGIERSRLIMQAVQPANFLIYSQSIGAVNSSIPAGSPMENSGIENKDRIVWVDGEIVFSRQQLVSTINQKKALLTVKRGSEIFLTRVPRLKVSDLRINTFQKDEISDWQNETKIQGRLNDLYFIPYQITSDCKVDHLISFFNNDSQEQLHELKKGSFLEVPLEANDQIIAVDGVRIHSGYELLNQLQTHLVQMIVSRDSQALEALSWKTADKAFIDQVDWRGLGKIVHSIGTDELIKTSGNLHLLKPVQPKPFNQLPLPESIKMFHTHQLQEQRKMIDTIEDPKIKDQALKTWQDQQKELRLGVSLADCKVNYNPSPLVLFSSAFQEMGKTIMALVTGILTPKALTGPIGIVEIMHTSWAEGSKEALFWLGMISLNLGVLNLLPIPVLDGGHICFSVWEWITKKPIKAKTMQKLVIPFVVFLVTLFIYLTYQDLSRIIKRFL
ncbi:site-2 protease family protein [Candidatus Rhabdochlamydia sp. T3358]|uniref:site-2 protease family protein n=1 Tax=Candidatus Rhabdochlamydia sp. T3358 TaxID=2099795 RepID=UPI0010B9000C|nr:site-2 protease family protein [Candidatus Rhabdochlamydia sp. T3358]VHO02018.1 Putative zinc metalloprotease [Candidatus Rhabdochlamydia sp. T3358]